MSEVKFSVAVEALDRFSVPARKMASAGAGLTRSLESGQRELNKLGSNQKAVSNLKKLEERLGRTGSEMDRVRERLASTGRAIKNTSQPAQELVRNHKRWGEELGRLQRRHGNFLNKVREQRGELRKTGVDVRDLAGAYQQLENKIQGANQRMKNVAAHSAAQGAFQGRKDAAYQRAAHMSLAAGGASRVGHQAVSLLAEPLDAVRQVERARGEIQSLGIKDTDAIVSRGQQMAGQWAGIDTASFTSAAYDVKSGISSLDDQGVADVTAAAAVTAKATKASVGQMTSLFAKGHGIFKKQYSDLSSAEFADVFSAQISSAVKVFSTDGAAMQQAIESMGGGLAASGISMEDQLSMLGKLQNTALAGKAGTIASALERSVAVAQTRFDKMGMSLDLLNSEGNMRSLPDIMEELQREFGESYTTRAGSQVTEAFGSEVSVEFFKLLWGQQDVLRANAEELRQAGLEGQKFTASMARDMDNNADARLTVMAQKWQIVQEKTGRALLPVLERLIPHMESAADGIGDFIDTFPNFSTAAVGGTAALGVLAIGVAPVITAFGTLGIALAMVGREARQTRSALENSAMSGEGLDGKRSRRGGKLRKFAKFGGGATVAFGALSIGSTLMDDSLDGEEKTVGVSKEVGATGGALAGLAAGIATGAAVGSVVPVVGTAVGAVAGLGLSMLGSRYGGELGETVGEWMASDDRVSSSDIIASRLERANQTRNQTVVQNITVQVPAGTDPRAVGEHVGKAVKDASPNVLSAMGGGVSLYDVEPAL